MRHPGARILVFARAPAPGACKTRLIPALGRLGAARAHRSLLEKTLETAVASGLAPVELWCAPDCRHPYFQRCRDDYGLRLQSQPRGDLGRRMSEALRRSLLEADYAVLIGTDCPALSGRDLESALASLREGRQAVFQPSEDGGYVLVGLSQPQPRLFHGIAWSQAKVMDATRRKLRLLGTDWASLPMLWDVDDPPDWRRAVTEGLLG